MSGLLAMLEGEPGGARVAAAIASARIGVFNYAEVVGHFIRLGMPEREVDSMLDALPLTIVSADKGLAQLAGRLRATTAEAGCRSATASASRWPSATASPLGPPTAAGRRSPARSAWRSA
jgi:PIN domain nuclease of toxin-antitoxin system